MNEEKYHTTVLLPVAQPILLMVHLGLKYAIIRSIGGILENWRLSHFKSFVYVAFNVGVFSDLLSQFATFENIVVAFLIR